MLLLLKKASSDACLNVAAGDCMKEYDISKKMLSLLCRDFDKLGASIEPRQNTGYVPACPPFYHRSLLRGCYLNIL